MSPQSLLHTPVELLRSAPAGASSHGERRERRAALSVVIGMVCVVALGTALGSRSAPPKPCGPAQAPAAAADCKVR